MPECKTSRPPPPPRGAGLPLAGAVRVYSCLPLDSCRVYSCLPPSWCGSCLFVSQCCYILSCRFVSQCVSMFHDRVRSIRVKMFVSIRAQGPAAIPDIGMIGTDGAGDPQQIGETSDHWSRSRHCQWRLQRSITFGFSRRCFFITSLGGSGCLL